MTFEEMTRGLAEFVRDHQMWAMPVVFALAFAESLAFLSLIIPAWGALVSIGALIGVSGISFWPVWVAAGLGRHSETGCHIGSASDFTIE